MKHAPIFKLAASVDNHYPKDKYTTMKISQPNTRHIRFDIDKSLLNQIKINYSEHIKSRTEYGKDNDQEWIGLRWNINLIDNPTGHEIVGQLSETRIVFERENKEKDLADLRSFAENSFMNCEMYFQDNAPKQFTQMGFINQPDFNNLAKVFLDLIYPEQT